MFAHALVMLLAISAVIGSAIPESHSNTTLAPVNSTSVPSNTTSADISTTVKPSNVTSTPVSSTAKPVNATSAPSNITSAASTTAKPVNVTSTPTVKPTNATSAPSNKTSAVSTVKPPGNSTTAKSNNVTTTTTEDPSRDGTYAHFQDVDPNTLACDPNGHVFLLLPSFSDCSKFYMCAHGEEVEFHCAPGTVFDFVIQTCNHPTATECILRTPKEDSETEGSGFGKDPDAYGMFGEEIENGPIDFLTADSVGTVRPVAGNAGKLYKGALNCQRADSASRQVAYKGDCQRYWRCVGAVPQLFYCPDGLHFNEFSQQCDYEANVKCLVQDDEELHGEFIIYK